jgi:two-component system response regulator YesN
VFEIDSLSAEVNYLPEDEKNLLIFSITNIAQEIAGTRLKCICFAGSDRIIIVFNTIVENEQLQEILIQIQECIKKYLKKTVSAGIGRLYANIKMLPVSYKEALEALKYKIYTGQESIVFIDDVQEKSDDLEMPSEHELEGVINCFHSEDESCLRKEIDRLFEKYINRTLKPLNYVDNLCLHILFTVSRYVEKTSTGIEDIFTYYDFKDIFRFDTIAAKKDCLVKFLANIRVSFNNGSKSSIRKIVVKILEYIDKNYCNSNISLNLIAEEFYKSSVYVSKLFKAETGENFIDYVTNLRIKKARGLLLDSLNLKAFEISQIVGYNDVSHFSKLFKKYTGLSPIEYRERSRPNNG